ncbi:beta-1,3-galactosyltransferase 1-like [Aulostomus maculatus]
MADPESGPGGNVWWKKWRRRQPAGSPCQQRKPLFQSWFLLLVCLVLLILSYTLFSSSLSWHKNFPFHEHYRRIFSWNSQVINLPPPYQVHPRHRETPREVPDINKSTTELPRGPQYHLAYPRNYRFIMDNPEACKTNIPFLVLMVPVEPKNVAARDAIRQTWGKENLVQGSTVLTLFMLGLSQGAEEQEKLHQENKMHRDLIQSDFVDSYRNLTIKTMVIMNWLVTHCPTATFAMKVDSDMFLNIDNLVIMLQKPDVPRLNYLTGMLMWDRPVLRSKDSKWYVPEEMYPESRYPTYALGMGYVFSNDLPLKFVEICKSIKPFNIEDAYIGMCMKKLGLDLKSAPNPSQFQAYNHKYNRCEFSKVITYILGSAQELVNYWTDLKKPGPPC